MVINILFFLLIFKIHISSIFYISNILEDIFQTYSANKILQHQLQMSIIHQDQFPRTQI